MDLRHLIDAFELEARLPDSRFRLQPEGTPSLARSFHGLDVRVLRRAYLQLLTLPADAPPPCGVAPWFDQPHGDDDVDHELAAWAAP